MDLGVTLDRNFGPSTRGMPEDTTVIDRLRSWTAETSNRALLRRAVVTCLVVGVLLTVINQGDRLIRGEFDATMAGQIGLTFLVPFVVATISGAAAVRRHNEEQHPPLERRRAADPDAS